MAHSGLKGKIFKVTDERILKNITDALNNLEYKEDNKGVQRAKRILDTNEVSYETMESMANFYRNYREEDYKEYLLLGGDLMKSWVNSSLKLAKDNIESGKSLKSTIMSNQYRKEHDRNHLKPIETRNLKEEVEISNDVKLAALCILFNTDKNVLLVQRSNKDSWMPGKWGFVGGGIEEGETPEDAVKRECMEEISINPSYVKLKFIRTDDKGTRCHMFFGLTKNTDVKLNTEHQNYKWCTVDEIKDMDCIPNVYEDVLRVVK
jgi:8-oxo-dGTP diphosphatase